MNILYITFIDFSKKPTSGSSVRPIRIYEAFKKAGHNITLIEGRNNNRKDRVTAYKDAIKALNEENFDLCYIEPPSGPLFYYCDRKLLKVINNKGVNIGLFYRDAYWKFPEFAGDKKRISIKGMVIRLMQQRDYRLIKKCCHKVYFPTELMASYFNLKNSGILPPGVTEIAPSMKEITELPIGIYVGGISHRYGTGMMLEAARLLNEKHTIFKLLIVCKENEWKNYIEKENITYIENAPWLEVVHATGLELERYYNKSKFALIPLEPNIYNDLAYPVKLAEYMSYRLPIVATNCCEVEKDICKHNIGLISDFQPESFAQSIIKIISNAKSYNIYCDNLEKAIESNSWERRIQCIIEDLV